MLRSLLSTVLLFFLAFGLAGMNVLMVRSTLAEPADQDGSSEEREEQTLRRSASRRVYVRGTKMNSSLVSQPHFGSASNNPRLVLTSPSPRRSLSGTGNFHGLHQTFRI